MVRPSAHAALAQLGNAQLDGADSCLPVPLTVTVALDQATRDSPGVGLEDRAQVGRRFTRT